MSNGQQEHRGRLPTSTPLQSAEDRSQGFRPYSSRRAKSANLDDLAGAAHPGTEATEATAGTATTHMSMDGAAHLAALAETATHLSGGGMDAGAEDPFDRNRSITSGHAAAAAAAADLAMAHSSMRAFTESFPPGPQHLLSQVPWYLQLQGMGQGAAILDAAAAGGRMHSEAMQASMEQRSRSFPSDARQRLTNLQAQQSAQLSGHKRKESLNTMDTGDTGDEDGGDPPGGLDGEDDDENPEQRVKRRLAQNREAARKSRQRRKQYVAKLEEEVLMLRWQVQQHTQQQQQQPGQGPKAAKGSSRLNGQTQSGGAAPAPKPSPPPSRLRSPAVAAGSSEPPAGPLEAGAARSGKADAEASPAAAPPSAAAQQPQQQPPGSGAALVPAPSWQASATPPPSPNFLADMRKWREEHGMTAAAVRKLLDSEASDEALTPAVEEARHQLAAHFQMKASLLGSEAVSALLSREHLPPSLHPFAWLGTLRPSEAAGGLIAKLGSSLQPPQLAKLESMRETMAQLEAVLSRGFDAVVADLAARAAAAPADAEQRWAKPEITGRLDTLRMLLRRADGAWEQFLEEVQRCLPLRIYAAAVISMHELGASLEAMQSAWLAYLRSPASES